MVVEGGQWRWGKAFFRPHCPQDVPPESGSAVCTLSDLACGPEGPPPMKVPTLTILSRWGSHWSASWMVKLTLSPPGSALASPRGCLSPVVPASHPGLWTSLGSHTVDSSYPWLPSWLPYYREAHWASWAPGKAHCSSHLWEIGSFWLGGLCAHAFHWSFLWNMPPERMNLTGPVGFLPLFFHRMHQA